MTPRITKIDMLLLAYATGHIGRYKSIMVVVILILSSGARRKLAFFEEIGGDLITQQEPSDIDPDSLEKILNTIDKN